MSALVADDKLTLLYQLQPGVCSKSFGVDVASIAHFPQHVIDDAKKRIMRLEGISDDKNMTSEEKRAIINEGETRISEFLDKIKQLESVTSDEELVSKFQEYKSEIANCDNLYVKCLM